MIYDEDKIKQAISIPDYFRKYYSQDFDLNTRFIDKAGRSYRAGKRCCPFHKEDTPSFSYDHERGIWMCFGKCHTGGDVIRAHQLNFKLGSREEAIQSLAMLEHIQLDVVDFSEDEIKYRKGKVTLGIIENQAISTAKEYEDILELDYIMTKFQREQDKAKELLAFIKRVRSRSA